jgi:hypothetical protein
MSQGPPGHSASNLPVSVIPQAVAEPPCHPRRRLASTTRPYVDGPGSVSRASAPGPDVKPIELICADASIHNATAGNTHNGGYRATAVASGIHAAGLALRG